jgi:hypothetical protein
MRAFIVAAAFVLFFGKAAAQQGNPLPVPEMRRSRTTSSSDVYERESAFKKKYETEADRRRDLEEELQRLRTRLRQPDTGGESGTVPSPAADAIPEGPTTLPVPQAPVPPPDRKRKAAPRVPAASAYVESRPAEAQPMVFAVTAEALSAVRDAETAIPLGSYVKARVLTGVEANTLEAYPVLLQLDYAFVGPNYTRIDLSHCFIIAKAKANLSTERVMGETTQLSCVRDNNEVVTRAAKGYIAGDDSTFGVAGQLISHQGQVLLAAVIASLVKGAGEAVSLAQTTTTVAGGNGAVAQGTNVTGSKLAYTAGKAVTEPASLIANWYLEYAKQLVPSIAVGSGRDVWVVLLDTVQVPPISAEEGELER